eukprot:TRINITY_DN113006_c0_g1_i1.p1 TRINITY_DN113006_c0_g1~~TRINITY_DN113006_c0_g1_i1.p1  ORF type:complete len:355 (-),score=38.87 TRINITY_DN113006_c0_g1_i1:80-1144(-)
MSRYLAYADAKLELEKAHILPPQRPAFRAPIWAAGPEEPFRGYLGADYKGGSTVCMGGRVAVGQMWPNVTSTAVALFVPGFSYMYNILPRYLNHESRRAKAYVSLLDDNFGSVQLVLSLVIMLNFFLAAFTNPGICPRNDQVPEALRGHLDPRGLPYHRFLRISGVTVKQKFCTACLIYRPPRSKHCSYCDNCVLRFDHHCPWLGNCVGLHNYRAYVCLVLSACVYLAQVIFTTASVLCMEAHDRFQGDASFLDWLALLWDDYITVVFVLYCVGWQIAVLLLAVYHIWISTQNLTTNEHVKNIYKENPFDFGPVRNCWQIYLAPHRVLAKGDDVVEADYHPFGSYSDGWSFDDS